MRVRGFIVTAIVAGAVLTNVAPARADVDCYLTHSSATQKVCISAHGNLVGFSSPVGREHIRVGDIAEGYVVCDDTGGVAYHDTGNVEEGFGPPRIVQPNGENEFPITVERTTLDGRFKLIQIFSHGRGRVRGEREIKISMDVVNLTSESRRVYIKRYLDIDIDGTPANDRWARTRDSVMAWEDASDVAGGNTAGLSLTSLTPTLQHGTRVQEFPGARTSCGGTPVSTPAVGTDLVGEMTHDSGVIGPGKHAVATVIYRRF
jgi:hypothetical protein